MTTTTDRERYNRATELYRRQIELGRLSAEIARKDKIIAQMKTNIAAIKSGKLARLAEVKVLPGMPEKVAKRFAKFAALHAEAVELRKFDCRKLGIFPNHFSKKV
jgi:hypothetical protein